MRDDIDPQKPFLKLLLVSRNNWRHPNGRLFQRATATATAP